MATKSMDDWYRIDAVRRANLARQKDLSMTTACFYSNTRLRIMY
jgi:hypothetical protein